MQKLIDARRDWITDVECVALSSEERCLFSFSRGTTRLPLSYSASCSESTDPEAVGAERCVVLLCFVLSLCPRDSRHPSKDQLIIYCSFPISPRFLACACNHPLAPSNQRLYCYATPGPFSRPVKSLSFTPYYGTIVQPSSAQHHFHLLCSPQPLHKPPVTPPSRCGSFKPDLRTPIQLKQCTSSTPPSHLPHPIQRLPQQQQQQPTTPPPSPGSPLPQQHRAQQSQQ